MHDNKFYRKYFLFAKFIKHLKFSQKSLLSVFFFAFFQKLWFLFSKKWQHCQIYSDQLVGKFVFKIQFFFILKWADDKIDARCGSSLIVIQILQKAIIAAHWISEKKIKENLKKYVKMIKTHSPVYFGCSTNHVLTFF